MRLYCPSCRAMYDEPDDRFHAAGGHLPCRVCMTPLVPHNAAGDYNPDMATIVSEPPSIVMKKRGPVTGGAAGGDIGYAGDGQKTTMLDAGMMKAMTGDGPGGGGYTPPPSPRPEPSPPQYGGPTVQYTPPPPAYSPPPQQQSWGGSAPPHPSGGGGGGNIHHDATVLFDQPRPNNPPPPMQSQSPPPMQSPPPQSEGQGMAPGGDPSKRRGRQVVIGGAAGSGSTGESLKTMAFDVKVIQDQTQENKALQDHVVAQRRPDLVASGAVPPLAGPSGGPVVVGSDFSSHAAPPTQVSRRGRGLLIGLIAVVGAGLVAGVLFLLGVFSGDGGSGSSPSAEESAPGAVAAAPAGPAPSQRADRVLRRLRGERIEPPNVYSGESASRAGYAVGVAANESGVTGFFVGSDDGTRSVGSLQQMVDAVGSQDVPVFTLFDIHVPLAEAIATLEALRTAGKHPYLAAGNPMGEDVYYTFAADAPADASLQVDLGSRGIVIRSPSWPEPRHLCYSSILPAEQLTAALNEALNGASEVNVRVSVAPNLDLQRALTLAAAISRPGLSLSLALAEADPTPAECAQ